MYITRLTLTYRAVDTLHLPPYKGATFRGTLGHVLKRLSCTEPKSGCRQCRHTPECLYGRFFTPGTQNNQPVPPSYMFTDTGDMREEIPMGDTVSVDFTLFGNAVRFAPHFLRALEELGQQGLGKGRGRVKLTEVLSHSPEPAEAPLCVYDGQTVCGESIYISQYSTVPAPDSTRVTLRFTTPVLLKHQGQQVRGPVQFQLLVKNLLRRWKMLDTFFCGDCAGSIIQMLEHQPVSGVKVTDSDLTWKTIPRWSNRQQQHYYLQGLSGEITYAGDLTQWARLLEWGQWLHVGKKTSFGLGGYVVKYTGDTPGKKGREAGRRTTQDRTADNAPAAANI